MLIAACGNSPAGPSPARLPLVAETATMRYYHEPGDTIDVPRQEAFNAWAIDRLGIVLPQKVEYRKYFSSEAMGRYTGNSNTNGFAEPSLWRIHTIWPYDNHELVHVYTATIGRPSDFFNEGIAVSFRTDPARGEFTVRFGYPSSTNDLQVHEAVRPVPPQRFAASAGERLCDDVGISQDLGPGAQLPHRRLLRLAPHGALRIGGGASLLSGEQPR